MSKIKILKAATYYPDFITEVYLKNIYDRDASYETNHRKLMDTCYAWSDFWKINLEALGGFEVVETVFNVEELQKKWAEENHFKYAPANWRQSIYTEQIRMFQPDVLVMQEMYHHAHYLKELKKIVPSIKLIVGWDGILYHNKETFADCDLILSCVQDTCEYYNAFGFKTHFFKFGFETELLKRLNLNNPKYPVSFVGSIFLGPGYHQNRLKLISHIVSKVDMNIWAASFDYQWKLYSRQQIRRMIDLKFSLAYDIYNVAKRNKGMLFGMDMFQTLYDTKITFNSHGENSPKKAANMRLFEATGVGTCLLSDWKENLGDFFEPDVEVVTYKSKEEAVDKINYLLNNEAVRKNIADAGQKRTLENYSYKIRMVEIANLVKSML